MNVLDNIKGKVRYIKKIEHRKTHIIRTFYGEGKKGERERKSKTNEWLW